MDSDSNPSLSPISGAVSEPIMKASGRYGANALAPRIWSAGGRVEWRALFVSSKTSVQSYENMVAMDMALSWRWPNRGEAVSALCQLRVNLFIKRSRMEQCWFLRRPDKIP